MPVNILRRLVVSVLARVSSRQRLASGSTPRERTSGLTHRRFLTANPVAYQAAIEAAESYVSKLEEGAVAWLHCKPFDATPANAQYFRLMFDLLNMLQAMKIPPKGRILEVGSGPGWVTEILLMLGFTVDALEPSGALTAIAKERCAALSAHYRHSVNPRVTFHQATLEDVEFDDGCFDAVLFFEAGVNQILADLMHGGLVVHAADECHVMHVLRELRQLVRNDDAIGAGLDGGGGALDFFVVGLEVKGVQMRHRALKIEVDDSLGFGFGRRCGKDWRDGDAEAGAGEASDKGAA